MQNAIKQKGQTEDEPVIRARSYPHVSRVTFRDTRFFSWARAALRVIYPPECLGCRAPVSTDGGLCAPCWRATVFLDGQVCQLCGAPVLAPPAPAPPERLRCEPCHQQPPPWNAGRAVFLYENRGRDLILAFKHSDRTDLAPTFGHWLARTGAPLFRPDSLIVPVPLARGRLFRRRYNQAALLAAALARETGLAYAPDALLRPRGTGHQEGRSHPARYAALAGAITPHPARIATLSGRPIVLVDDVMTSGATFAAATTALFSAGAASVSVLPLARVAKTP